MTDAKPKRTQKRQEKLHASCVAISSHGVLFIGKSGSGKSDLALRMITFVGATLVADDVVVVSSYGKWLIADADPKIRGLLEVRGVGLVQYPVANQIPIALVINLVPREEVPHIPEPVFFELQGIKVPQISLCPSDASTPAKIQAALYALARDRLHTGFLPEGGAA